jgi:predicted ATPase
VLSRIKVENFRCLKDISLDLKPLTFLVGPNGSGKSSVLLAIQLLKQCIAKGNIQFNGEFVELRGYDETLYSEAGKETLFGEKPWITIEVDVKLSRIESDLISHIFNNPLISRNSTKLRELGYKLSFDGIQIRQSYLRNREKIFTFAFLEVGKSVYDSRIEFPVDLEKARCSGAEPILNADALSIAQEGIMVKKEYVESFLNAIRLISKIIREQIESTYYISVLREPRVERADTEYHPRWVGRNGEHTVGLLALIFGSREYEHVKSRISEWANVFGLEELRAGWRGRQELSADFRDPNIHSVIRITSAGYGSVQILPIITQLFWSRKGSTISFEEPEISLHLELVSKLPLMFSEAIKEDKQLIVTTHEQNIFFALGPAFAKKELSHEKVALYELQKSGGGSTATRLELTPDGAIKGGISSFVQAQRNMIYQWTLTLPSADEKKSRGADKDEQSGSTSN